MMRRLVSLVLCSVVLSLAALAVTVSFASAAPTPRTISVCSYDASRTLSSFTTGDYATLRAALLNPANFGSGGIVNANVTIQPGINTATAASLSGCTMFFTGVIVTAVSATEATAVADAVKAGMVLILDADSSFVGPAPAAAANAFLAALGGGASVTSAGSCPNSSTGGTLGGADTQVTNGPFGDIRGQAFATSLSSTVAAGSGAAIGSCGSDVVRSVFARGTLSASSGLVMVGGDPSGLDLFTSGILPNPNNLTMYLNAFAASVPTNADQCKNGGWATYRPAFKNQGDCIQYVNTGK